MKKFEEYYIGLDMGTGSVGWAVTDPTYNIIKRHGKALWGIRLFESAKTAEERRIFRTSRRRTERRKNRLHLLQEIFAEEISKKDMGFYQRMKESKYWHEDKKRHQWKYAGACRMHCLQMMDLQIKTIIRNIRQFFTCAMRWQRIQQISPIFDCFIWHYITLLSIEDIFCLRARNYQK